MGAGARTCKKALGEILSEGALCTVPPQFIGEVSDLLGAVTGADRAAFGRADPTAFLCSRLRNVFAHLEKRLLTPPGDSLMPFKMATCFPQSLLNIAI